MTLPMPPSPDSLKLVTIDGSSGEGGGQILRTSLALSLITRRPIAIDNIRARRPKPGLQRQHLAAVRAAAEVGAARVEGDAVGSKRLVFRPGEVQTGDFQFRIGTAGSTTLVLQTVLPALLCAAGESKIELEGGTHNPFAPPFDFLARAYLPLVSRMGPSIEATLARPGFYPAGGGSFHAVVRPVPTLGRLNLLDRGDLVSRQVRILVANLPRHIGEREQATIALETGWSDKCFQIEHLTGAHGPGNVVLIELTFEHVTEVCCGFGSKGVPAETVALAALREAQQYEAAGIPVGEHLADQLLLPLGIGAAQGTGGGSFLTGPLSSHARTHINVLRRFLDVRVDVEEQSEDSYLVRVA